MDLLREEILAAHLRYGNVAESLRTRAYAQLVSKVILLGGRDARLSVDSIGRSVSDLVGGAKPTREELLRALTNLERLGVVEQRGKKWQLKRKSRENLEGQVQRRRQRVESILRRHFPGDLDPTRLARWFDGSCTAFFSTYGDRWVSAVARRSTMRAGSGPDVPSVVGSTAAAAGFKENVELLISGFNRFLNSDTPEDNEHLWSLGMAMFASRLVCAGLSSDPISTRELRDSTILMDTNVLLAVCLEAHSKAGALEALGTALQAIGADLCYAYATQEEYRESVGWRRDQTLQVLDRYGFEVLRDSTDYWVSTAVGRYCRDPEDFERFFDQIVDPPATLGDGLSIRILDEPEVAQAAEQASGDNSLIEEIQVHTSNRRGWKKGIGIAKHDAALTGIARYLRGQGGRCWILTLDLIMHDLALRWAGPTDTPLWVSLDTLLQVLAVDHAGTTIDPVQFGPILARLIANEVEVSQDAYTIEDLQWLDEAHRDIASLPLETVKEIAQEIHSARMRGVRQDDPELTLTFERVYQRATAKLATDHAEVRQLVVQATEATARERTSRERMKSVALQEIDDRLRRKVVRKAWFRGALGLAATALVTWVALQLLSLFWEGAALRDRVDLIFQLSAPVMGSAALIWKWVLPVYRKELGQVPEEAMTELGKKTES